METQKLNLKDWNVKLTERSRGRMKLQIKLSKEESEAFKNFTEMTKPTDVDMDQFIKAMFLTGIETYNQRLAEQAKKFIEENKERFEGQGVTPDNATISQVTPPNVQVM
jgi:hypothetical protein